MTQNLNVNRIRTRAAQIFNNGGAAGLWFAFVAEVGYRRLIVREFSLRKPIEQAAARIEIQSRELTERDLEAYNDFRQPADRDAARKRLLKGDACFVAWHGDTIVGACWVSVGTAWNAYLSAPIPLARDEAYSYDLYTAPRWRGENIPTAVMCALHSSCRAKGFKRVIGLTIPENRPAMNVHTGYRNIGVMGYVGVRNRRHLFCRMNPGERAPGQHTTEEPEWDASVTALMNKGHYLDDFLANMKRKAYLELIEHWGGIPAGARVLKTDVFEEAMGPDAFLLELPGLQSMLVGMDVSGIAASRARVNDAGDRASYVCADTRTLPFADHSIDMIISPSTLDHFATTDDLDLSLNELRRVLAEGGRMIVTLDNRQNVFDPLLRLANLLGRVPYYLGRSFTVGELRRRLEGAGFDVVDTTAIVHHPRLMGVTSVAIANRIGSRAVSRFVHSMLLGMQGLRGTRLQYYSGCFVAALAHPREAIESSKSDRVVSSVRTDRAGCDRW